MPESPEPDPTTSTASPTTTAARPTLHARLLRRFRRMAIAGVVLYVIYALALFAMQDKLIYPRFMIRDERSAPVAKGVTKLERRADVGDVHAWLLMPTRARDEARPDAPSPLVVFFHGNAESAGSNIGHVRHYRDAGFAVLIPEYRGYAGAAGTPTEAGIVDDAMWFIDEARRDPRVDERLVLHGRSLGGGVAAQIAAAQVRAGKGPDALILESSFTSIAAFARKQLVPAFLLRSPFRTDRVLASLERPVLILHGSDDTLIPISHAQANAKRAKDATLVELAGDHNDFPRDEAAYWRAIDAHLERVR